MIVTERHGTAYFEDPPRGNQNEPDGGAVRWLVGSGMVLFEW